MLTLWDGNSDGLEMLVSLGSLTIHFRHMTERGRRSGGMESGQVLRVMSHIVLSLRGVNDRSRLNWQFAQPEKHPFGQLKQQIDEKDAFRERTSFTLHKSSHTLIISHYKCF